ncbi:MAG: hypothetical protein GY711_19325 [bacterium]|nr:hypothetical protein [bacterium]
MPTGHLVCPPAMLAGARLARGGDRIGDLSLDSNVELFFDPKRVRAAQAGVPLVAPRP